MIGIFELLIHGMNKVVCKQSCISLVGSSKYDKPFENLVSYRLVLEIDHQVPSQEHLALCRARLELLWEQDIKKFSVRHFFIPQN